MSYWEKRKKEEGEREERDKETWERKADRKNRGIDREEGEEIRKMTKGTDNKI
jgi:hypothetical protein